MINTLDVATAYIVGGSTASLSARVLLTRSVLTLEAATLSIPGSTLLVRINALMLKRTKLTGIHRQVATAPTVALTPGMATS